jgi:hypothetical protein
MAAACWVYGLFVRVCDRLVSFFLRLSNATQRNVDFSTCIRLQSEKKVKFHQEVQFGVHNNELAMRIVRGAEVDAPPAAGPDL